jgi:hypothetical protein
MSHIAPVSPTQRTSGVPFTIHKDVVSGPNSRKSSSSNSTQLSAPTNELYKAV